YVLGAEQRLLGVVSFRDLVAAPPEKKVRDIMHTEVVTAPESMDQEALSRLFAEHDFLAIPVIDAERHVKGIVTVDDIVDVVQEEATEDIQKIGGMEALDAPYLEIGCATAGASSAARSAPGCGWARSLPRSASSASSSGRCSSTPTATTTCPSRSPWPRA